MPKCFVNSCSSRNRNDLNVIYHPLPRSYDLRAKWVAVCKIKHYNLDSVRICSLHFQKDDYICKKTDGEIWNKLKKSAVPTLRITDDISGSDRLHSRIQKREIRSYVLATQRRISVHKTLDCYSLQTLNSLALSSCRYNTALFCKISEKDHEISKYKRIIKKLRKENESLRHSCKYWQQLRVDNSKIYKKFI